MGSADKNAADGGDKTLDYWGRFCHGDQYLTVKNLALTDIFAIGKVIINPVFWRERGNEFLTGG